MIEEDKEAPAVSDEPVPTDEAEALPEFFDANTPGRLAFEAVASFPRWWARDSCDGLKVWESFLAKNPDATLGDCLNYFQQRMELGGDPQWSLELLRSIGGKAYPDLASVAVKYLDARRAYFVRRKGFYQTPQQRKVLEKKTQGFCLRDARTRHDKGKRDH